MRIGVINNKTGKLKVYCLASAARIVGVCRQTVYNWIAKGDTKENYRHFTLIWNAEIEKQNKTGHLKARKV